MSNTIVTKYSNSSGGPAAAEAPLVIIVNKDNSVCMEKNTIQTMMTKKEYENRPISIVRINEDGKPDDASDHSADDDVPHVNLTVDGFYEPPADDPDSAVSNEYLEGLFDSGSSLIGFQNDHCYTPLTSPGREPPHHPHSHRSHESPTPKSRIPSSKKITVLESKIIPKGKTVQYFNPSGPCEILKGTDVIKRTAPKSQTNIIGRPPPKRADPEKPPPSRPAPDASAPDTEDGASEDDGAFVDRESDSDFDPDHSENLGFEVKSKKSKTSFKRDVKKILSRKIEMRNNGIQPPPLSEPRNSHSKIAVDKKNSSIQRHEHRSSDSRHSSLARKHSVEGESIKPGSKPIDVKNDPNKNLKTQQRKERKPSAQETALLNDMTSLFSTPDVIRRVSTESKVPSKSLKRSESVKGDSKISPSLQQSKNQKECLDIMQSLDEENLVQLLQDPNAGILAADSIAMGLNTIQPSTMEKHDPLHSNPNMLLTPVPLTSSTINAPLSPNLDILSGLQPDEEGLTEDLLRHVAQLVESSENLQEVIDKQVLGKIDNIAPKNPIVAPQMVPEAPSVTPISNISKKEPIKVVRKDGVVITLPPIEAPTTRSSKRKSTMNTVPEPAAVIPQSEPNKVLLNSQLSDPKPISQNLKLVDPISQMASDKKDDDAESDQSWNSEDDPDRLWCICKQPHNNRFMICCDLCEDWFHGKCVNITKAIGKEMEIKGVEWRCPNCIKKGHLPNPAVKALQQRRRSLENKQGVRSEERISKPSIGSSSDSNTNCIVCKKPARPSSIYCSDACILKHAQESLIIASPPSTSSSKTTKDVLNKTKQETRVIVFERKSGKVLAGHNAPTMGNLKSWLQEHPTYEVVRPGTVPNPKQSPSMKPRPKHVPPRIQSVLSVGQDKQITYVQPGLKSPTTTVQAKLVSKQTSPGQHTASLKSPPPQKQQAVKPPLKSPTTPKSQNSLPKTPTVKSPTLHTHHKRDAHKGHTNDPIRNSIKKGLGELITSRMGENSDIKFTQAEISKFSEDTERELYDLFKDTGTRYKSKYRSLMFNLKDRKNLTLWEKICNRTITPKQLVRLSPEELASQELAQWRDKETKHQLELIKKSELDLLACNKTYVLKTHKGEEVMESQLTGTAELDPNVSVEDIVTELNKSVDLGAESIDSGSRPATPVVTHRDVRHSSSSHHKHSSRHKSSRSHKSSKSGHSSSRSDKSKHSSSKDTKSASRSHHGRRDKERSDKDRSSRRHSRSRRHSHSRSKSRSKTESDKKRSKSRDKRRSQSSSRDENKSQSSKEFEYKPSSLGDSPDNIAENLLKIENVKSPVISSSQGGESDQEPTSTVDSILSAVWTGSISMIDVAKFNVSAHEVSGVSDDVIFELDSDLDVVGRIKSDAVWDYIGKMRKQSGKDILILRFTTNGDDDKVLYKTLYTYLYTRSRLGVIKVNGGGIKDFYILPLPSESSLPTVIQPINGPGFEDNRSDMLLGIIVKQKRKRGSQMSSMSTIPTKIAKVTAVEQTYTPPNEGSYTPPSDSPKRKLPGIVTMPIPGLSSSADDEPYSPGGSDSGSQPVILPEISATSTALQRKMEELTRKIEEEKKQIKNITGGISTSTQDEPYSPSRPMTPSVAEAALPILSNISLPSNIHEILANIQNNTKPKASDVIQEPYIPGTITNPAGDVDMRMLNPAVMPVYNTADTSTTKSKLSTLSDAELLSMVPDEILLPATYSPSPMDGPPRKNRKLT